jgi:hypothetical protein
MDDEIGALRQEVDELKAVTLDTNRTVHKLRRGIWWGRLWTLVWWVAVFGLSGAAYYYYAEPYIQKLQQYYAGFQQQATQAQTWESQAQQMFNNFIKYTQTQPSAPSAPQGGQ